MRTIMARGMLTTISTGHTHSHGPGGHSHGPLTFDRAFAIGISAQHPVRDRRGRAPASSRNRSRCWPTPGTICRDVLGLASPGPGATLARRGAVEALHLWAEGFDDPRRAAQRAAAAGGARRDRAGGGAADRRAARRSRAWSSSVVAAVGIVVNAATAWLFARGRKSDINMRGAYLHMAADAMVSAGVVLAGLAIWWTGGGVDRPGDQHRRRALIFWQTWGLLRETVEMSLNAVPRGIDFDQVEAALKALARRRARCTTSTSGRCRPPSRC